MAELSSETILQIDATIITGILILLTIGRTNTSYEISKWTSSVVLPFVVSAIIELIMSVLIDPPDLMRQFSISFMIIGFGYIGWIVLRLPKIRTV